MQLRVIGLTLAMLASASSSALAEPGTIGLFFDQEGTDCSGEVPPFVARTLYIYAKPDLNLPGNGGIRGAEFRIKGKTANMIITSTANPSSSEAVGDPFSDESQPEGSRGGANIAFTTCEEPDENCNVLLYTVSLLLFAVEPDIVFEVDRKDPPSNILNNDYAFVNACDDPVFTAHEVIGIVAYLNGNNVDCYAHTASCTVTVEEKTWSSIKKLYD